MPQVKRTLPLSEKTYVLFILYCSMLDSMQKRILVYDIQAMLRSLQGDRTLLQFAAEIGVTQVYVGRVMRGKDEPGPSILKYLKLRKVATIHEYEAI
jgi:transcriptional regulator with XRE-family HTH domain